MEYREIVAVTGLGGLFHLLATKSDGAIVKNLSDKTTKFISARLHNVTPLESIEIYTNAENVRLHKVLQKMQENEAAYPVLDAKSASNDEIKAYFGNVFPDMDKERVYVSDMKKMLKWYELLKSNDLLNFEALEKAEADAIAAMEADESATEEAEAAEEKPVKKATKKKAVAETKEEVTETAEEKPVKKATKKKAAAKPAEDGAEEKPVKKTAKKKKEEE